MIEVQPADNLDLAKLVHMPQTGAPVEASMRCACGRAYYAAHVVARELLIRGKLKISASGRAHREVIDLLRASTDLNVQALGQMLDQLHATRKSADYDLGASRPLRGKPFDKNRAALAIALAEKIIDALAKHSKADRRLGVPGPTSS